ncbi:MAG: nuclear transport factor 2 family protein [Chloroflexota bacterium]
MGFTAIWRGLAVAASLLTLVGCGGPSPEDVATAYWDSPTIEKRLELVADDAVFTTAAGIDYVGKDAIRELYTTGTPTTLRQERVGTPRIIGNTVAFDELTYPKGLGPSGVPLDPNQAYHIEIALTIERGKITRHVVACTKNC